MVKRRRAASPASLHSEDHSKPEAKKARHHLSKDGAPITPKKTANTYSKTPRAIAQRKAVAALSPEDLKLSRARDADRKQLWKRGEKLKSTSKWTEASTEERKELEATLKEEVEAERFQTHKSEQYLLAKKAHKERAARKRREEAEREDFARLVSAKKKPDPNKPTKDAVFLRRYENTARRNLTANLQPAIRRLERRIHKGGAEALEKAGFLDADEEIRDFRSQVDDPAALLSDVSSTTAAGELSGDYMDGDEAEVVFSNDEVEEEEDENEDWAMGGEDITLAIAESGSDGAAGEGDDAEGGDDSEGEEELIRVP